MRVVGWKGEGKKWVRGEDDKVDNERKETERRRTPFENITLVCTISFYFKHATSRLRWKIKC